MKKIKAADPAPIPEAVPVLGKITIEKTSKENRFMTEGLTDFEIIGMLRHYERRMNIKLLQLKDKQ